MGHGDDGTVVVLTALEVEYRAARARLAGLAEHTHPSGTLFEVGWLDGTGWRVALAEIGAGNGGAAVLTERAIAEFRPRAVFFVGVAGTLKPGEVRLGDVVVATRVYAYHGGKEENGEFQSRPSSWPAPHDLEQRARRLRRSGEWAAEPPPGADQPRVHLGPVAAGEVVLNSADSPLKRQLRSHYQDAVAIEMESAGMAQAAHLNRGLAALTVRGISDCADGGKYAADAAGWQSIAAGNAAAFAFSLIRGLPLEEQRADAGPAEPVHVADSESIPRRAPSAGSASSVYPGSWRGGHQVSVADREYLLHDDFLAEVSTGDHRLITRQAVALVLNAADQARPPRSRYVWIRQAQAGADTDFGRDAVAALARERDLLGELQRRAGGLPAPVQFVRQESSATLVVTWPLARSTGLPCPTLAAVGGRAGTTLPALSADPWRLHRLLTGLGGLCRTLSLLHASGRAHRCLTPSGIVELDDGRLMLRDLGLSARRPWPGEGPPLYQAPEQGRRGSGRARPGPWTDVFQLAALTHHLVVGRPAAPGNPLPLRASGAGVPEELDDVLRAALAPDPADRPDLRVLRTALRGACQDLA